MSYNTQQLSNLEALQADFDTAVSVGDKKLAFKILGLMTEMGMTVEAHDMFSDILMRMTTNHIPLLGIQDADYSEDYSQEEMNGGFNNINSGNYDD